ncbi:hypothetical protein B0A49_05760 [Cryomyces minteri]|uniref:Fibronectin type-III domain-containing protein n=1 Tax=Cryomyces minteri TaxID=331657 RepID=A0A4U0XJY5_9PEZI|nr:hypothetical protein B0A49_05760 [Cryomyces minteri]
MPSDFQRLHCYADPQLVTHAPYPGLLRFLLFLDGMSFLFSSWLQIIVSDAAMLWLVHRAYQVLTKPLEELIQVLGLELPKAPVPILASLKADGVVLRWKPPDQKNTVVKHQIQVDGFIVGEASQQDTSVTVTYLKPDHFYTIRVIAVNSTNFHAASQPIRFKTRPAASGDYIDPTASNNNRESPEDDNQEISPAVQPYRILPDTNTSVPAAPLMAREHSNNGHTTSADGTHDHVEVEETVQQLTERLDTLRKENEELEKQAVVEEDEFQTTRVSLIKERDDLKHETKERDDRSKKLKKQVADFERNNLSAQNKKVAQEKLLQQKINERKKLSEDVLRWNREIEQMKEEMDRIHQEVEDCRESTEQRIHELREGHDEDTQAIKSMEEEIRERGVLIKDLEEERKGSKYAEAEDSYRDARSAMEAEEDRLWDERLRIARVQYVTAYNHHQETELENHRWQQHLAQLNAARHARSDSSPRFSSSTTTLDNAARRTNSQRSRRTLGSRTATLSSSNDRFPASNGPVFGTSVANTSPKTISTPFFNIKNGSTIPDFGPQSQLSQADVDVLTGGAPMSPSAGSLLPSGLLGTGDDEDTGLERHSGIFQALAPQPLPGLGATISGLGTIPGLGAPQTLEFQTQGPTSPNSVGSHSPSVFASPQASANNLQYPLGDSYMDSDRQSIRSIGSNRAASGSAMHESSSRFGQIFGFDKLNRQRGKTLSDESPSLGSLSKIQSHSMPRQEPGAHDLIASRRRNSSHSGNFLDNVLFRGSSSVKVAEGSEQPKAVLTRRRPFAMFSGSSVKGDGWPTSLVSENRPSSPRPASTHSTELPRPSQDSSRWPSFWPTSDTSAQRSSPLGNDWAMSKPPNPLTNTISWERHPSRRPSIQYGSSSNLSGYGIIEADYQEMPATENTQPLAPIGTPLAGSAHPRPVTPKLNPAAKDFKSLFSFDKRNGENRKGKDKDKEKDRGRDGTPTSASSPTHPAAAFGDHSPQDTHKSRDSRSLTQTSTTTTTASESLRSSRDSFERAAAPEPVATPVSASASSGRESFMQKISRKSSSGKFSLPVFGKDGLFASSKKDKDRSAAEPGAGVADDNNGGGEDDAGRGADAGAGTPTGSRGSGLSWNSIRRMGKKGDKTPSISEASAASEAGDEREEDEEEERASGRMSAVQ